MGNVSELVIRILQVTNYFKISKKLKIIVRKMSYIVHLFLCLKLLKQITLFLVMTCLKKKTLCIRISDIGIRPHCNTKNFIKFIFF